MPKNPWTQIAVTPLVGMLDTRSRPAEMAAGSFRYKLNMSVNRTGSLCTRSGHAVLDFGSPSGSPSGVANWDFHRQGGTRSPVSFLLESTSPTGVRRLFAGTDGSLDYLDNATSEWVKLSAGGSGSNWKAAPLEDKIVFTNNTNGGVLIHTLGSTGFGTFTDKLFSRAKVVITYSDVVLFMNVDQGATSYTSRVWWSDYKLPNVLTTSSGGSVAGWQDLDYGDEILAAAEMMGALYIFTTKSIWRCVVNLSTNTVANTIFSFTKIYSEPKNQNGCLRYANTLVSTGKELYWMSQDSIWTFNPYIVAPESPEWLLKGSGALFSDTHSDRMEKRCCEAIVAEFHPVAKEIWISYPQGSDTATAVCLNNRCLVLNVEYKTIDLVDHGYSAFVNFRKTPGAGEACNADQIFIGASTADYCLKSIGGVFWRELVSIYGGAKSNDIPDGFTVTRSGYFCRLVGACPFGFPNIQKAVRELLLDHETADNTLTDDNLITLRIGNSFNLVDPMGDGEKCSPQWHEQESLPLACADEATISAMSADNLRPSDPTAWTMYEEGNRLYFDLRVTSSDGMSAPMQHDSAWSALRFDVKVG